MSYFSSPRTLLDSSTASAEIMASLLSPRLERAITSATAAVSGGGALEASPGLLCTCTTGALALSLAGACMYAHSDGGAFQKQKSVPQLVQHFEEIARHEQSDSISPSLSSSSMVLVDMDAGQTSPTAPSPPSCDGVVRALNFQGVSLHTDLVCTDDEYVLVSEEDANEYGHELQAARPAVASSTASAARGWESISAVCTTPQRRNDGGDGTVVTEGRHSLSAQPGDGGHADGGNTSSISTSTSHMAERPQSVLRRHAVQPRRWHRKRGARSKQEALQCGVVSLAVGSVVVEGGGGGGALIAAKGTSATATAHGAMSTSSPPVTPPIAAAVAAASPRSAPAA
jgi:hypothetical protein